MGNSVIIQSLERLEKHKSGDYHMSFGFKVSCKPGFRKLLIYICYPKHNCLPLMKLLTTQRNVECRELQNFISRRGLEVISSNSWFAWWRKWNPQRLRNIVTPTCPVKKSWGVFCGVFFGSHQTPAHPHLHHNMTTADVGDCHQPCMWYRLLVK